MQTRIYYILRKNRLLPEDAAWDAVSLTGPVRLCELDSAGNMKPVPLFSGYPERAELKEEGGYRTVELSVVSGTALLDRAKHDRVFQSPSQTYAQIAERVTSATEHSAYILSGQDAAAGGTLIQYRETDWQFLKRMAARMGLPLVPDSSYYFPRFYIGLPEGPARELPDVQACSIRFDGRYYDISGRYAVDRGDFLGTSFEIRVCITPKNYMQTRIYYILRKNRPDHVNISVAAIYLKGGCRSRCSIAIWIGLRGNR